MARLILLTNMDGGGLYVSSAAISCFRRIDPEIDNREDTLGNDGTVIWLLEPLTDGDNSVVVKDLPVEIVRKLTQPDQYVEI